jgi:hypothetical protein
MCDLNALLGLTKLTTPPEKQSGARRAQDRSLSRRALTRITSGAVLVAALTVFAAAADARQQTLSAAAFATPTAVAPANGLVVDALPAFSWAAVANADRYEFQLAADAGMNSPVLGRGDDQFTTRNTRATLKKTIPNGTYWWRVRALQANGTPSPWSPPRAIVKSWTSAPALQSPTHGATMVHPTHPLVLRWSSVPRAAKYQVTIATDPALGSAVLAQSNVETHGTSYAPRALLLPPGTYYWAVVPMDAQGHRGARSTVGSFTWTWPTATAGTVGDLRVDTEVYDPFFSWDAVPGAAKYELEVNPTQDFALGSKVCCSETIVGTSHAPMKLMRDNKYFWRVRSVDSFGNAGQWNVGPEFTKTFDKVPPVSAPSVKNVRMRDNLSDPGSDVDSAAGYQTNVPVVTWDPVPGASSYEVDVFPFQTGACNWSWSGVDHWHSITATNAWTPLGHHWNNVKPYADLRPVADDGNRELKPEGEYCVRVRARSDRDTTNAEVYGDYTYMNGGVAPAFQWDGPPVGAACSPSCASGNLGASDYLVPSTGTTSRRMPYFTWKPLAGKQSYFVLVAKDASFSNIVDYAFTQVPAYAPRASTSTTTYSDETTSYYWAVLPANDLNGNGAAGNPLIAAPQDFLKESNPPTLTTPTAGEAVGAYPTFRWAPAEHARYYTLQVSQDPSFGTKLHEVRTASTAYTTDTAYPADTVLYWRVRANDEREIGLRWSTVETFRRTLPSPVLSATNPGSGESIPLWTWAPVNGAVAYDVEADEPDGDHPQFLDFRSAAFTATKMTGTGIYGWRVRALFPKQSGTQPGPWSATKLYTRTIAEPGGARTERIGVSVLLSWNAKPAAKNYRILISQRADFQQNVEQVDTDNTSYAPTLLSFAYRSGGTFWWRVAAQDEDRNIGDFSPAQQFTLPKQPGVGATALTRLKLATKVVRVKKGRRVTVTVRANGRAARGAVVRAFGRGVTPRKAKTNRYGRVTFVVKKLGRGKTLVRRKLDFQAAKTGFVAGRRSIVIRY